MAAGGMQCKGGVVGVMRRAVWISVLVCIAAGLATAGTKKSANVRLLEKTTWNGKPLPVGDYKVTWEGEGPDVKVTLRYDDKVVAEGSGRLEEAGEKASVDGAVTRVDAAGGRALVKVLLGGKTTVLVFSNP